METQERLNRNADAYFVCITIKEHSQCSAQLYNNLQMLLFFDILCWKLGNSPSVLQKYWEYNFQNSQPG